jgi:hypothetical protein
MAVGLVLGAGAGVARAQAPAEPAGSVPGAPAVADSLTVKLPVATAPVAVRADSAGRGRRFERRAGAEVDTVPARARRGRFEAPRWVMLRSLAFPGWGQLHNGSWLKAIVIGGGESWIIVGMVEDNRRLRQLREQADRAKAEGDEGGLEVAVNAYNSRLDRFVSRQWLLGGLLIYSLMDAYVDAHFRDFKVEFEYDRALKGGKPPAGQARLALRWVF